MDGCGSWQELLPPYLKGIWRKVLEGKQGTCSLEVAGMGGIVGVDPWIVGMVVVEGTI